MTEFSALTKRLRPLEQSREDALAKAYGLPEKIWIAVWAGISLLWFAGGTELPDFWTGVYGNLAILALLVLLPQLTLRLGELAFDVGRMGLSGLSIYLAYERVADFIAAFRPRSFEYEMILADEFLFGGHASVALQAIQHPVLTEYLQVLYIFYFPQLMLVGLLALLLRKRRVLFEYLIALNLAFLFTHTFYFLVPVASPFFVVSEGLYTDILTYEKPLVGLWFTESLRQGLLDATTMRHDCFPSGHTMHSLIAMFFAWRVHKAAGAVATIVALSIVFSTLYLRYHYAIDLVVGAVFAVVFVGIGIALAQRFFAEDPSPQRLL